MRKESQYFKVIEYYNKNLKTAEISRILNIPRSTINGWVKTKPNFKTDNFDPQEYIIKNNLQNIYSYILGLYLGDGHISKMNRTFRLRIFNDIKYEKLNQYIIYGLEKLFLTNKTSYIENKSHTAVIVVYSNKLPEMFPQHGAGKKSNRKIKLNKWQDEIISHKFLLMGLIHSDGCYYNNIINGKAYSSYSFSNTSNDIHNIFQNCCDKLGIKYTKSTNSINTQICKRKDVLFMEKNIGTKKEILLTI